MLLRCLRRLKNILPYLTPDVPRLYKKEKLCSKIAIGQLFGSPGADFAQLAYPLRVVARVNPHRRSDAPVAFLISIPKKRLRHAVDRVLMRRRIREAYRLERDAHAFEPGTRIDMAFIYVADRTMDYPVVARAVKRLLEALTAYINDHSHDGHHTPEAPASQ